MKYIVPLFRENTGKAPLGSVNWDLFQAGFSMVMREKKFMGVTWDPWWRERKSGERRKGQQRSFLERRSCDKAGHRLCSEGESFQPLRLMRDRRANRNRRNGSDRRKSASREKLVAFAAFIRELGKGALSDENARLLIGILAGLTTREVYNGWTKTSGMALFFKQRNWTESENRKKFRDYAAASFLELLRPGTICWRGENPNADQLELVSRIVSILGRATENAKLQSIRAFFKGTISLEGMRKLLSRKSLIDKKEALQLVWANRKLKPKAFHEKLRGPLSDLGIELSPKPNSYRKQIERLKNDAALCMALLSR